MIPCNDPPPVSDDFFAHRTARELIGRLIEDALAELDGRADRAASDVPAADWSLARRLG
jgi:hypothetical protein